MKAYLIRRLLLVIPTFLGISMISFAVIQLGPGSPIYMKLRTAEQGISSRNSAARASTSCGL